MRRADVVTIQTTFPTTLPVFFTNAAVLDAFEAMLCLVEGGMMSTRAVSRS